MYIREAVANAEIPTQIVVRSHDWNTTISFIHNFTSEFRPKMMKSFLYSSLSLSGLLDMGVGAGTTRVEEVGSRRHLAPAIIVLNRAGVARPTQAEGVVGETVAMGVAHPMEVEVLVSICIF